MGYLDAEQLPFYSSLARQFPIGDPYFSSVRGQTYPNRRFLIAGTALGNVATKGTGDLVDQPPGTPGGQLDLARVPPRRHRRRGVGAASRSLPARCSPERGRRPVGRAPETVRVHVVSDPGLGGVAPRPGATAPASTAVAALRTTTMPRAPGRPTASARPPISAGPTRRPR